MIFAQIPEDAITDSYLRGLRFEIYCAVVLECYKNAGLCSLPAKVFAEKYKFAYDNFSRTRKELLDKGYLKKEFGGIIAILNLKDRVQITSEEITAKSAVKSTAKIAVKTAKSAVKTAKIAGYGNCSIKESLSNNKKNSKKESPTGDKKKTAAKSKDLVKRLFEFWQKTFGKYKTLLTESRKKLVIRILKEKTYADCVRAILGCKNSPWHKGENPDGTVYQSFELIFRNVEKIEFFNDKFTNYLAQKGKPQLALVKPNGGFPNNDQTTEIKFKNSRERNADAAIEEINLLTDVRKQAEQARERRRLLAGNSANRG